MVAFFVYSPLWFPMVGVFVGVHVARQERRLPGMLGILGVVVNGFFSLVILGGLS
jgi:hypothetical protein